MAPRPRIPPPLAGEGRVGALRANVRGLARVDPTRPRAARASTLPVPGRDWDEKSIPAEEGAEAGVRRFLLRGGDDGGRDHGPAEDAGAHVQQGTVDLRLGLRRANLARHARHELVPDP